MAILEVNSLQKIYTTRLAGNQVQALSDVSFSANEGEYIAIMGESGSGKTTLLKIINGMLPADSGQIRLGSKVHIGYYDQEHQVLHPDKTLFDEIQDAYLP